MTKKLPTWRKAYDDYLRGLKYREIAAKYGVTMSAVRRWQQRYWRYMVEPERAQQGVQDDDCAQDCAQQTIPTSVGTRPKDILDAVVAKQRADTTPTQLIAATGVFGRKLLPRERRFVEEYLIDYNATAAAIRAGYEPSNAKDQARELLARPAVAACIAVAEAERSRRTGLNAELIARELARLVRVNPADVVDLETGKIKPGASPDDLAAIANVRIKRTPGKYGETTEYDVRFTPKDRVLELAAKIAGLLVDRHHLTVDQGGVDLSGLSEEELQRELERQTRIADAIDVDAEPSGNEDNVN